MDAKHVLNKPKEKLSTDVQTIRQIYLGPTVAAVVSSCRPKCSALVTLVIQCPLPRPNPVVRHSYADSELALPGPSLQEEFAAWEQAAAHNAFH